MRPNILPFVICLVFILCTCQGQYTTVDSTTVESRELGQVVETTDEEIWAIYQDERGDYWFGSNGSGVFRYDGKEMRRFTVADGLVSDSHRRIIGDADGNVYFDTQEGVGKWDGKEFTALMMAEINDDRWQLNEGDLWFNQNASRSDLLRYDGRFLHELKLPEQPFIARETKINSGYTSKPYSVYGLDKDAQGNLWIGTETAGAYRFDGQNFLWIGEEELFELETGQVPAVRSIRQDANGDMWLSNTLHRYHMDESVEKGYYRSIGIVDAELEIELEFPYFMSSALDPKNGDLYFLTYGNGVYHYDGQTLERFDLYYREQRQNLMCMFQDREGNLWIGTRGAGVYRKEENGFERVTF